MLLQAPLELRLAAVGLFEVGNLAYPVLPDLQCVCVCVCVCTYTHTDAIHTHTPSLSLSLSHTHTYPVLHDLQAHVRNPIRQVLRVFSLILIEKILSQVCLYRSFARCNLLHRIL